MALALVTISPSYSSMCKSPSTARRHSQQIPRGAEMRTVEVVLARCVRPLVANEVKTLGTQDGT